MCFFQYCAYNQFWVIKGKGKKERNKWSNIFLLGKENKTSVFWVIR